MKHVKLLGLMLLAMASLMAFAASASATTYTSPTGTTYTGTMKAESTNSSLDGAFTTVSCKKSVVEGKIEQHGTGVTAKGNFSTLDFTECNFPVTVLKAGSTETHPIRPDVVPHKTCLSGLPPLGDGDTCQATVTSTGAEVTIATSVGSCIFTTSATSVGTETTTAKTGGTA
ncbi:MAG TPA: hypothetical protein VN732_10785, partial [Solirubrobacterales bacterium]|nr:hypothetical protein [Solirubrobacterales bacterium]